MVLVKIPLESPFTKGRAYSVYEQVGIFIVTFK